MVILHVHKCCIRIGLTIIVPSLEAGRMPVVGYLPFPEPLEKLQIFLIFAFSSATSIDELCSILLAFFFQIVRDFLQILCSGFRIYSKRLHIIMIQKPYRFLNLMKHFFFPFPYGLFPDESIFIGTGFQLGSINENGFHR